MDRVRNSRISKGSTRGRGRPRVEWTSSRQRRLLRLYLCTPESYLSLETICRILTDKSFEPKVRLAQCKLQELLMPSYRTLRPANRVEMKKRLQSLRVSKSERRDERSGRGSMYKKRERPDHKSQLQTFHLMKNCSLMGASSQASLRTFDSNDSTGSWRRGRKGLSLLNKNGSVISFNTWLRSDSRKDRVPNDAASSFCEDVRSLISSMSFVSSIKSLKKILLNNNRSSLSFLEDYESVRSSRSRSNDGSDSFVKTPENKDSTDPDDIVRLIHYNTIKRIDERQSIEEVEYILYREDNQHPDNEALILQCCGNISSEDEIHCAHRRLASRIKQMTALEDAKRTLMITPAEANVSDAYGNNLLHVAARWQALGALHEIIDQTEELNRTNYRGENFLHALHPHSNQSVTPNGLAELFRKLVSRGFDFLAVDQHGLSCIHSIVMNSKISLVALEACFETVGRLVLRNIARLPSSTFGSLEDCIKRRAQNGKAETNLGQGNTYHDYLIGKYITQDRFFNPTVRPSCLGKPDSYIGDSGASLDRLMALALASRSQSNNTVFEDCFKALVLYARKGDALDLCGNAPQHYAAALGIFPALKAMHDVGADLTRPNRTGERPIDLVWRWFQGRRLVALYQDDQTMTAFSSCLAFLVGVHGWFDGTSFIQGFKFGTWGRWSDLSPTKKDVIASRIASLRQPCAQLPSPVIDNPISPLSNFSTLSSFSPSVCISPLSNVT